MLVKEKVLNAVQELPEQFSVEQLLDQVMILEKIERGIRESDAGSVVDTSTAKERLSKWLQQ